MSLPLWKHQIDGIKLLSLRPEWLLADDVGLGKTRQLIEAQFALWGRGEIDAIIVVAPDTVCAVWEDPDPLIGEFAKFAPEGKPYTITRYSTDDKRLPEANRAELQVVVTNYEFIRRKIGKGRKATWPNLEALMKWTAARKTWLVLDESWMVQNSSAKQTHAAYKLRQRCRRVTCVNGTPGSPAQTFAQFQILNERILNCPTYYLFKQRYCLMGGRDNREIVGYRGMDEFERLTKPYVIRREGVLDLPARLPPMTLTVKMTEGQWTRYKSLRDEAILELTDGEAVVARQAGVKHLRLAQFLAGFVGGVETLDDGLLPGVIREIGQEKLNAVTEYVLAHGLNDAIVWCRFKPEMDRMAETFRGLGFDIYQIRGDQRPADREAALKAFAPGAVRPRKSILIGQPAAGGAGVNLAGTDHNIYDTNTFSLKDRDQSEGRTDRPGQTRRPRYVDVVMSGPKGQRTVDHSCIDVLRNRRDVATWTKAMWVRALMGEPLDEEHDKETPGRARATGRSTPLLDCGVSGAGPD